MMELRIVEVVKYRTKCNDILIEQETVLIIKVGVYCQHTPIISMLVLADSVGV